MNKELQKAYQIVYLDMVNSGCGLFVGRYDAMNGDEHFMYGISTVMEYIAHQVSEEDGYNFSEMFNNNLIESKKKASEKIKKGLDKFRP